ncbi:hypothetical protein [Priestia flexa]|uniref:Uncharacterized protein n=1 Tax=Priestia flexa TaxID=86664 RepID=A0A8I1SMC1_9BACI|nr:hypothetical protein [Priestia flexa]MBN8252707.1 hypothetical protein [Priestia flexa]
MIDTILYLLFTIFYVALFLFSIKLIKKKALSFYMLSFPLVIIGLIYDNLIIFIGSFIGEGNTLFALSLLRFWLHALFTPTLILFGYGVAKHANISWANKPIVKVLFLISTAILISYEVVKTISHDVAAISEYGIIRYGIVETSGPPIMVIVVALILLFIGISIFKHMNWSIMMIGVAVMIVGSAIPFSLPSTAVINLFEVIFMLSLALTHRHLVKVYQYRYVSQTG